MRHWTTTASVAGALAAAAAPILPFATSGARTRSGYDLLRTAWSAGVVPGYAGKAAVVAVGFLPLLAAGAFAAASLRRRLLVATLSAMAGVISTAAGAAVLAGPLPAHAGTTVAVAAGVSCVAMALIVVATR